MAVWTMLHQEVFFSLPSFGAHNLHLCPRPQTWGIAEQGRKQGAFQAGLRMLFPAPFNNHTKLYGTLNKSLN